MKNGSEVESINIKQYSNSYPPKVNIDAGATVEKLQLNDITASNIKIEDDATITTIIWKKNEYTSIADFKTAAGL